MHNKKFRPTFSERTAARCAAVALKAVVLRPEDSGNPDLAAFYMVVSDPEHGMVRLQKRTVERVRGGSGTRVVPLIKTEKFKKFLK